MSLVVQGKFQTFPRLSLLTLQLYFARSWFDKQLWRIRYSIPIRRLSNFSEQDQTKLTPPSLPPFLEELCFFREKILEFKIKWWFGLESDEN